MDSLAERRKAEFPQYERPEYFGNMKPWRVALIAEWLAPRAKAKCKTYLDVGCGTAETRDLARAFHFREWRGCEVVASCCRDPDVDLIPGAHKLPYRAGQFDITTCNDVLEHVLEDDVPAALSEIRRVTSKAVLLGISGREGTYHICVKDQQWWWDMIRANTTGTVEVIFENRVPKIKQPYFWFQIRC